MTRIIPFFARKELRPALDGPAAVQMEYLSRCNGNAGAQLAKNRQITFGRAHSPRGKGDPPDIEFIFSTARIY
jgi:hypothetical protein